MTEHLPSAQVQARVISKVAYGALFLILLPALFVLWAWRLDKLEAVTWPVAIAPGIAILTMAAGLLLMLAGMHALWVFGKGLPMNAFPPKHLVERSIFKFFSHPIYVGFAGFVFGFFALVQSPSGFWLVAPVALCAVTALVFGYEAPELRRRLGDRHVQPLFSLPDERDVEISLSKRVALILVTWAPWAVVYALFSTIPSPLQTEELRFSFEWNWPRAAWSVWLYSFAYPFAALAPLAFRKGHDARFTIQGIWAASAIGFAWMLLVPGKALFLPPADASHDWLFAANGAFDAEWLACPSFHTAWAFTAAGIYARRFSCVKIPAFGVASLIAISCVTTGEHALIDVVGGILLAAFALNFDKSTAKLLAMAEGVANSWTCWTIGPLRIINHAAWTVASGAIGTLMVLNLAGAAYIISLIAVIGSGTFGALAFGWIVEGKYLSRPFGYFGFLLGALAALAVLFRTRAGDAFGGGNCGCGSHCAGDWTRPLPGAGLLPWAGRAWRVDHQSP